MRTENINLYNGDCLEFMRTLPDNSVDMCLTDPPYGTTPCKWDNVIPFEPMWAELKRIVKPNGAIVLFGSQPFTSALIMSNTDLFKYSLVWEKGVASNFLNFKYQFGKSHEDICIFGQMATSYSKKGNMSYYAQMETGKPYVCQRGRGGDAVVRDKKTREKSVKTENTGERYPKSVLKFKTERGFHPTQKPVALLEYLIKTYTLENETVLDFTMGSGSTGVACVNTNRKFIGCELDKEYFEIAKNRIDTALWDSML